MKEERVSFNEAKKIMINKMKTHINEEIVVINKGLRNNKGKKGKLVLVTDNTATFEFSLGNDHKEYVSYLLSDLWRGSIELEGVPFETLSKEEE